MKKIFLVLAVAASLFAVEAKAQVKKPAQAKAAVEKAEKDINNPKKNTKADVWIKYGQSVLDSQTSLVGNFWTGMSAQEFQLLGSTVKPIEEPKVVEINGTQKTVYTYPEIKVYFGESGVIEIIEIYNPIVKNANQVAFDAFKKAAELDVAGKKTADITKGLSDVSTKFNEEAFCLYSLGRFEEASAKFEMVAISSATDPLNNMDKEALYNAAWTAWTVNNLDRAKKLFEQSIIAGYAGADGEAYAKLSDIAVKEGNAELSKTYLEDGFKMYPQSQSILVGLINYYMTSGENTNRLFELINEAKKNEPENASLYYVEGQIHEKLGHGEEAVAAYQESVKVNPNYEFGYIGEGIYFYNKAVDLQTKAAEELDDAKYMALIGEFETALKASIVPFEKAFEITKDPEVKISVAEYLKNACFRFRTDEAYQAKYDFYANYQAE